MIRDGVPESKLPDAVGRVFLVNRMDGNDSGRRGLRRPGACAPLRRANLLRADLSNPIIYCRGFEFAPLQTTKKAEPPRGGPAFFVAEWTGLEPATPGVTGRYSNQLNYHSITWWVLTGSNRRPSPCKGDALPAELSTRSTCRNAS